MALLLKINCMDWINESRDKRELSAAKELGLDTLVMAKGEPHDNYKYTVVDGFNVVRFSTRPLGKARILDPFNRLLSLFLWSSKVRKLNPDIISGHDISGVLVGYLSTLFRRHNRPYIVYDSHEFELGRNTPRSKLSSWFILSLEKFLSRKCAFVIAVNDTIADELQRMHHLTKRPVVVRSTPNYWEIDESVTKLKHLEFCKKLGVNNNNFVIMYHGLLAPNRGIEKVICAVGDTNMTIGVILGSTSDDEYYRTLKDFASKKAKGRVLFLDAVPIENLWEYVGAADAGVMIIQNTCKSYFYSLPNKFFENIQSLTPIVVPDYPEMKRIVEKYNIGLVSDGSDESIVQCINRLMSDKDLYKALKKNLLLAKSDLCWENEKTVLLQAYGQLIERLKR